jgi:hypothetical protein
MAKASESKEKTKASKLIVIGKLLQCAADGGPVTSKSSSSISQNSSSCSACLFRLGGFGRRAVANAI